MTADGFPIIPVTVLYSCLGCGLRKQPVSVPSRGAETAVEWVGAVGEMVGADHARRSPLCRAAVCDLMIPWPDAKGRIGDPRAS